MSTQPHLTPQWKEEVNRRLAAHKNRKGLTSPHETTTTSENVGNSRAAQAAARVAARYAKAPTYSQMQAEEARVAVRAAEIATKVALEAQAAAESALAELHAAAQEQPSRGPAVVQTIPVQQIPIQPVALAARWPEPPVPVDSVRIEKPVHHAVPTQTAVAPPPALQPEPARDPASYAIRFDPDLPVRRADRKSPPPRPHEEFELSVEDWWRPAEEDREPLSNAPIEVAQTEPAHANLIHFPRPLVATRKIRPRLAETYPGAATDAEAQLSIFEVDPRTISTEVAAPTPGEEMPAQPWSGPEWSGLRLDDQPAAASASSTVTTTEPLAVAPFGLRLMAAVVDGALVLASFVTAGFLAAHNFHHPPTGKAAEALGIAALAFIGLLYYALFFALEISTPGMKYAGIALCTFDDQTPTRVQLRRRLGAMALSLLPVGLGLAWAVFDEDHLSWHDRFSQTYPRKL